MYFYTIQTLASYIIMQKTGVLITNPKYVADDDKIPYRWMIHQAQKRILTYPKELHYPIWLWTEKPELQDDGHLPPGTPGVLLTVQLKKEAVLLSEFFAWHSVLNNHPCFFDALEEKNYQADNSTLEKELSWERVFDLDLMKKSVYYTSTAVIQGITAQIRTENIVKATHFIAVNETE